MTTLITGATGLIGRRLLENLADTRVLSRDPSRAAKTLGAGIDAREWAGGDAPLNPEVLDGVDAVIHLAVEPIAASRWNPAQKERIRASRVEGTRALVSAMAARETRPRVLVCASAIGYYGDRGDEELSEDKPPGEGFLSDVCVAWEEVANEARALGVRVVTLRIGVVLSMEGGALSEMMLPFKMGVGGKLGHGRQWMPWVHLDDVVGLIEHALTHEPLDGPMNAVAPGVVTNADFTRALGRAIRRPTALFVPRFALRAALGELSELLLNSHRVVPTVAQQTGYSFRFPEINAALTNCVRPAGES